MPLPFRPLQVAMAVAVSILASAAPLSSASAQAAGRTGAPTGGTWGAEAGIGFAESASLLRFVSPSWAVVAGGSLQRTTQDSNGEVFAEGTFTNASLQVGVRKYARSGLGLRPLVGAGVSFSTLTGDADLVGGYVEAGAAYFFNAHLSLGALGTATYTSGGGQSTFTALVPRVLASIYF